MDRDLLDALIPELTGAGRTVSRLQQHLRRLPGMPEGPLQAAASGGSGVHLPSSPLRARPVSEMDLAERFHALLREHATFEQRGAGEELGLGDLVQLDVLAFRSGEAAPFAARDGVWSELAPTCLSAEVYERLAGAVVGESYALELPLPTLGAGEGVTLRLELTVRAAREVFAPDAEDPRALRVLGRGESIAEVMHVLAELLAEERAAARLLEDQRQALLGFAARSAFAVPEPWVDAELLDGWEREEARVLRRRGWSAERIHEARAARLQDGEARARVRESFQEMLALEALSSDREPMLRPDQLEALVLRAAESFGMTLEVAREALAAESGEHEPLRNAVWYLMALENLFPQRRTPTLH